MERTKKHLSAVANDLLRRCAQTLDTSVDALVQDFELGLKPEVDNYSRKLVEFCSSKALEVLCCNTGERIGNGSLSRFTFDMMLSWETPSSADDESYSEALAKEAEDEKKPLIGNEGQFNDEIPLFYSDIMPLLVNGERSVGEEAFVWFGSLFPLVADVTNARFTFETLTAPTASKLHYPAYDRFLREIDKCIKYLLKQSTPTGFKLAEDEFILHVDGTASTQRVINHIGSTSWPGRLTLTNKALYFEASKAISYETALRIEIWKPDVDHQVKAASTGPWGAPLFDKAIAYESSQLPEPVILEFPEVTSSTRRDHWLTLVKEIILLHQFISKFDIEYPLQAWEMHSRTILGIIRLHAAREMLRIAPPAPTNFLIFSLFDDLPKGDYVLQELSSSLKKTNNMHPCSATSTLKSLGMKHPTIESMEMKEGIEEPLIKEEESLASLGTTIDQVREEAKETNIAKATVEGMKEEGISDSLLVLVELLSPVHNVQPLLQSIIRWERPMISLCVLVMAMVITYKEWVGYASAASLMCGVGMMMWARHQKVGKLPAVVLVSTASDKTTMESLVAAQHSLKNLHEMVKKTNIAILKCQSIVVSRAPKHTAQVMLAMTGAAALLAAIPFKFAVMSLIAYLFTLNLKLGQSSVSNGQADRRLREWWDAIPVVPVRTG
ncbi:uncharacterized protein A4U43_C05F16910 [Asparagus officinalis]|uniref:Uncharacterized protein n=1 Tax=Asparagus officinalis TaxID=4686 RepID=A0A5P1EWJ5_ASPOF|nr:uncharacterized protein LOC109843087 [Asparagus officinalis]ONK68871.1 uncharacterized protein A4U43_C05F16910 [Asparagus officinalis]